MSLLVVTYLFLGGVGAGVLLELCVLDMLSPQASKQMGRRSTYHPHNTCRVFFQPSFIVCSATMLLGTLCLIFDLGRPDRILNLFINPTYSFLTIGSYTLLIALFSAGFLTAIWSGFGPKAGWPRWFVRSLEVLGMVSALAVMLYTGLLFYSIGTGTFLDSPLIPALFILSALSCGLVLIIATSGVTGSSELFSTTLQRLIKVDSFLLILELLVLASLIVLTLYDPQPNSSHAVQSLLWGSNAVIFWLVLVAGGLLIPLALENSRSLPLRDRALVIASIVLMGGFVLRWILLEVGLPTSITGA